MAVQRFAELSTDALRAQYESETRERRLYLRSFDVDVARCIRGWTTVGDRPARDQADRCLRVALNPWITQDPEDLASRVTAQGSRDQVNLDLRDAALHFAQLWLVSSDVQHAKRASALLSAFARSVPEWPIWSPYYDSPSTQRALSQHDPSTFQGEFAAGIWGAWIYMDLVMSQPLLEAWDILRRNPEFAPTEESMRRLFGSILRAQRVRGASPDYSNMDAFVIRGKFAFGLLLPEPDLVHDAVRHLRSLYRVGFYPDGWWCEGSFSYHSDLQRGLRGLVADFPASYTDPPGYADPLSGDRFDRLNLRALVMGPSARADDVIRRCRLPNGSGIAVHDSDWTDKVWLPPTDASSGSHLFGAMGQATLCLGSGTGQTRATLHFGPSSIHHHRDALNLHLWAKNREVISETNYRPPEGSDSTREWQASTPAHVTVVVDGADQANVGPLARHVRQPTAADSIDGIADWRYRWGELQAASDYGRLRLFNTEFRDVQVVEADATDAYSAVAPVTLYRRTVALVRIDERDSYLLDVFRVRGGSVHDYMLHGCLNSEGAARVTPRLDAKPGKMFGMIGDLQSGPAAEPWLAAFDQGAGTTLYSIFPQRIASEVTLGSAPAMRRQGHAPFVVVHRSGGDSTFVVVHHVASGGPPRVRSVEMLDSGDPRVVACRIQLNDRVDTVISSESTDRQVDVAGGIRFRGSFAHLASQSDGARLWAYLVDGSLLEFGDLSIRGTVTCEGSVSGIDRVEAGGRRNAFRTDATVAGDGWAGQAILVDPPGLPRWAYRISGVDGCDGGSAIATEDEPGLAFDGDLVHQLYFPNWSGRGRVSFRMPGSALLLRDDDGRWFFRGTGKAVGRAPGM